MPQQRKTDGGRGSRRRLHVENEPGTVRKLPKNSRPTPRVVVDPLEEAQRINDDGHVSSR